MKFTCYKNDLVEALQIAIRSVAVKPMTPILSGIYMRVDDGNLEMQANNFNTSVSVTVPVNSEVGGEVVLSGKKFLEVIRNMPEDTITLFGEEAATTFSMESGGANIDLLTMPSNEFPKVKVPETDRSFRVTSTVLKNLIRKTIFAVSKDDDRPIFKGCSFELDGNRLTLVATNTHRIAIARDFIRDNEDTGTFVVPAETLRGFLRFFNSDAVENYVDIKYSDRYVTFKFDNVYLTSRVIEGEFPPYDRIVPTDAVTRVDINKAEFRDTVDFVSLIARETDYNTITFDVAPGNVKVSADSPEVGDASKSIETDNFSGEHLQISFNVEYISDALRTLDTDQIQLWFNGKYEPMLIREKDNDDFSYVVTPVRT